MDRMMAGWLTAIADIPGCGNGFVLIIDQDGRSLTSTHSSSNDEFDYV
jgi:hypothetical protein